MSVLGIVGPTAAGKSAVALRVAAAIKGEIWSVDSMQVYREMDIGTAKPSPEVQASVPHHLIDLVDPSEPFTVAEFQQAGAGPLRRTEARPILAGGSGLHFRALVDPMDFPPTDAGVRSKLEALGPDETRARLLDLDPSAGGHVDLANPRRVTRALEIAEITGRSPSARAADPRAQAVREYRSDLDVVIVGIDPGEDLARRVERRFDGMLDQGLLDEVRALGPKLGVTAAQAVGYKELLPVVRGEATIEEARGRAITATLQLAKRQRTFFRRDPRIRWLAWHDDVDTMTTAAMDVFDR